MLFEGDERQDGKLLLLTLYGSHLIRCLIRFERCLLEHGDFGGRKTHRLEDLRRVEGVPRTAEGGCTTILVSADGMK